MKRLIPLGVTALVLFSVFLSAVYAEDQLKLYTENRILQVKVTKTTPDTIFYERSGMPQTAKVGDVESLTYEGEPSQFKSARQSMAEGRNEDARTVLTSIKGENIARKEVAAEHAFLLAQANARIAFQGGDTSPKNAIAGLDAFLKKYTDSYRRYEALQLQGDLNLEIKETKKALEAFTELSKVKDSPMTQARGCLGRAKVLLSAGKNGVAEAEAMYKAVQSLIDRQELKADVPAIQMNVSLGVARCAAINGKHAEAQAKVQQVIKQLAPEDGATNALAYNTLGDALSQEGKPKDAIVAYLHTHLLYSSDPSLHADALTKLAALFRAEGNHGRAQELEDVRMKQYGK